MNSELSALGSHRSASAGMGCAVSGWYSVSPSYRPRCNRASGCPDETCGSSDSGSEPEMYRICCPSGGTVLPKYDEFSALVVQPAATEMHAAIAANFR